MLLPLALFFGPGTLMVSIIVGIIATVFWLWMLVAAITHERTGTDKLVWVLVIVLLHVLGAVLYFMLRYRDRNHPRLT